MRALIWIGILLVAACASQNTIVDKKGGNGASGKLVQSSLPVVPANSTLLDFNRLPNGRKPKNNFAVGTLYADSGVAFVKMNSTDRQGPIFKTTDGDACRYGSPTVTDRARAKPPSNDPFNVRIEFSIPVRSVSADVFAGGSNPSWEKLADGSTILVTSLKTGATMTAYDSQGKIIDSLESRYEGFAKGRLGISSNTLIAAVQWVSSEGLRTGVGIDNLMFSSVPNELLETYSPPGKPVNEIVFVNGKIECHPIPD